MIDYSVIETGGTIETTYVNGASASTVLSMDNISDDVGEMIKNGILQTQHKVKLMSLCILNCIYIYII